MTQSTKILRSKGSPMKASTDDLLVAYQQTGSLKKTAELFGMCAQSVHARLQKIGATVAVNKFTDAEKALLQARYQIAANAGQLDKLAADMGRTKPFICRQASLLGLTSQTRSKAYLADSISERPKAWHAENDHPRGALGMKHSAATKERISETSQAYWNGMTEDEHSALTLRQLKARVEKHGSLAGENSRGSWKAGWREVGPQRRYFRSRWEANYARYLEWLRVNNQIQAWQHEPETFWFESIKRGVRSYLPDFLVTENSGAQDYHEVKGWMDGRSRTTISRFRKYYPQHSLIVIDATAYNSIKRKVQGLVGGWE